MNTDRNRLNQCHQPQGTAEQIAVIAEIADIAVIGKPKRSHTERFFVCRSR